MYETSAPPLPVSALSAERRAAFIIRTYGHLVAAIFAFVALEVFFFTINDGQWAESISDTLLQGRRWLMVLIAFSFAGTFASNFAHRSTSQAVQYAALGGYVLIEALIFIPMLYLANEFAPGAISSAAYVTVIGFAALTAVVFVTRKDFSFMKGAIMWLSIAAFGIIVVAILFGLSLGTWFSIAMIGLAGMMILYTTSKVMRDYPEDRYVAASLALFSSVALMFWYVLRLFMSRR